MLSILVAIFVLCNLCVYIGMTKKEMIEDFWINQNVAGKVFANLFYFPAWVLKWFSK